jgi:hypothetical protein
MGHDNAAKEHGQNAAQLEQLHKGMHVASLGAL